MPLARLGAGGDQCHQLSEIFFFSKRLPGQSNITYAEGAIIRRSSDSLGVTSSTKVGTGARRATGRVPA